MTKQDCNTRLTSDNLQTILEVNKKSIEIYLEVEQQNEKILTDLKSVKDKIEDIDKYLFRLQVILGGIGISTIIAIVQVILGSK